MNSDRMKRIRAAAEALRESSADMLESIRMHHGELACRVASLAMRLSLHQTNGIQMHCVALDAMRNAGADEGDMTRYELAWAVMQTDFLESIRDMILVAQHSDEFVGSKDAYANLCRSLCVRTLDLADVFSCDGEGPK